VHRVPPLSHLEAILDILGIFIDFGYFVDSPGDFW